MVSTLHSLTGSQHGCGLSVSQPGQKSHSSWTPAILTEFQWWKKKEAFHSPPEKLAKGQRPLRNHATCWRTMSLSHKVRQTSPYSPLILSRHNLFPPSKCSNSFQLSCCCCHCYWLSIRHGVIKEWRRNCLGSAVALIALSEPSGRFFIKGGHEGERGGGWRCPPDKSVRAGSHCLVQPGSTRVSQFRVGTWQAPLSNRAVCTRPQTALLPSLILHRCPCQGLFVYPSSPSTLTIQYCFPPCQIILPLFSNLFCIFLNFIY